MYIKDTCCSCGSPLDGATEEEKTKRFQMHGNFCSRCGGLAEYNLHHQQERKPSSENLSEIRDAVREFFK